MTAIALYLALSGLSPIGQNDSLRPKPPTAQGVHAIRTGGAIEMDGVLAEAAWSSAPEVSDFTQREPHEGAIATEQTQVRVLYDDNALYVGARLYDRSPDSVRAQLARRDRIASADRFVVYLDCYHDRRTGFYFGVNADSTTCHAPR